METLWKLFIRLESPPQILEKDRRRLVFTFCNIARNFVTIANVPGLSAHLVCSYVATFNTLRPKNGRRFVEDTFKCVFLDENIWISTDISLKFLPKGPINNIPALVQIKARRRPVDKPLSELMMVSLLTHIYVTRPQCVNPNRNTSATTGIYCDHRHPRAIEVYSVKLVGKRLILRILGFFLWQEINCNCVIISKSICRINIDWYEACLLRHRLWICKAHAYIWNQWSFCRLIEAVWRIYVSIK